MRFRFGPRRATALVAGTAGMAVFGLVTLNAGTAWGLVLLAGMASAGLIAAAVILLELKGHRRYAGVRDRAMAERWQVLQGELRQLRSAAERERTAVSEQLEAVSQVQQRAAAAAAWQAAHQAARLVSGEVPSGSIEAEVALVRGSDLFDPEWYQRQVGMPLADPVAHYVEWGAALGLDPHRLFPAARYLERYPEALTRWRTPLAHYLTADAGAGAGGFASPTVRYDRLGNPDPADVRWEYLARGLHREPDTFVLYRIIGNDLPPRHRAGQAVDNLRFVLDHEPELPGCQKRWVVNRIVDPRTEKQIIALLEEHGQPYLHIPFEPEQYRRVGWRFAELDPPGLTYRSEFDLLNPNQRQRALDHVYHYKNLYLMNNNGARNAALREGRGLAKWVLPWDGNCFLTRPAWDELVAAVTSEPYLKYFTVPMARVVDNQVLLRPDPVVCANEEPQLLFRRDAVEEFNPDARYGRRPKVELFYRLRIPGPWDDWGRVAWDGPPPPPSPEARQVGQGSWVARLFSGQQAQEADSNVRQWRRIEAIRECIDAVDEDLTRKRHDPTALFVRSEAVLERHRARWLDGEPGPTRVVAELVGLAERALRRPGGSDHPADPVLVLALAGWFTRQERFFTGGARALRAELRRAGAGGRVRRSPRFGLAGATDLDGRLDAARLLEREGALTATDTDRLRAWCGGYRVWLADGGPGAEVRASLDHRGTWYDVQLAALDAYLGEVGGLLATLRRAHERVGQQLGPDREHLTPYNLLGWVRLALGADRAGKDLWSYRAAGGYSVPAAVQRLLDRPRSGRDSDRLAVLAHLAAPHVSALQMADTVDEARRDPWQVRQVYDPDTGVAPFWVLGSEVDPR